MTSEDNNQNGGAAEEGVADGTQSTLEEIKLSKTEYDDLQKIKTEHGSFKRELKELRKPKELETVQTKPEDSSLLKKAFLRSAGLTAQKEQELALETAKKWGIEVDALVEDEDWNVKLDKFRASESNALATSHVRGGGGTSEAKNTTAYWKSKGEPPSAESVPDRKTRQKIVREMLASAGNKGARFYNE